METDLSIGLEGITNIHDVARISLKLEILKQTVRCHRELREICHEEFTRRMNDVMFRHRCLMDRRQQNKYKLKEIDETAEPNTQISVISVGNLSDDSKRVLRPQSGHKKTNPDNIKHYKLDNAYDESEYPNSQSSPLHYHTRRNGTQHASGIQANGKGGQKFRKISLAIGGALRTSARRRRNTYPDDTRLYVGKLARRLSKDKINNAETEQKCDFAGGIGSTRSRNAHHVNRIEPHLAVTRKTLASPTNTTARDKVRRLVTRVKVIKTFQSNL